MTPGPLAFFVPDGRPTPYHWVVPARIGRRESRGARGTADKTGSREREKQRAAILARWGAVCWLCDRPIRLDTRWPAPGALTRDHVIPRSRGGSDDVENLRPAHKVCNETRGARRPDVEI